MILYFYYYLRIYICNNIVMKKERLIMIRLDEELFLKYKKFTEKNRTTMSHEIRQNIIIQLNNDK